MTTKRIARKLGRGRVLRATGLLALALTVAIGLKATVRIHAQSVAMPEGQ